MKGRIPAACRRGNDHRSNKERGRKQLEKNHKRKLCPACKKRGLCKQGRRGWAKGYCVKCAKDKGYQMPENLLKRSHHKKKIHDSDTTKKILSRVGGRIGSRKSCHAKAAACWFDESTEMLSEADDVDYAIVVAALETPGRIRIQKLASEAVDVDNTISTDALETPERTRTQKLARRCSVPSVFPSEVSQAQNPFMLEQCSSLLREPFQWAAQSMAQRRKRPPAHEWKYPFDREFASCFSNGTRKMMLALGLLSADEKWLLASKSKASCSRAVSGE